MKAKGICKIIFVHIVAIAIFVLFIQSAKSDVGGGSGTPMSPYLRLSCNSLIDDIDLDLHMVRYVQARTSKFRRVVNFPGYHRPLERFLFEFCYKGKDTPLEVFHSFKGIDKDGDPVDIDFSFVESFTVLGEENNYYVVELNLFPYITPETLLTEKPTYVDLDTKYRKTMVVNLPMFGKPNTILSVAGKIRENRKTVYRPLFPFSRIEKNKKIEFDILDQDYRFLWWATPSVYNDPAYPYRVTFLH